jgi:hypothetical protein
MLLRIGRRSALVVCALAACGGGDKSVLPGFDGGSPGADGGTDGGGISKPVPDAAMDIEGPVVEILSPVAPPAGSLQRGEIVTEERITVLCRVTPNPNSADPIDTGSVKILASNGDTFREATGKPTPTIDQYTADLSLVGMSNGPLQLRCTAADRADEPRANSVEISTFLDLGPTVTVYNPVALSSVATQVDILFRIAAAPVTSGDTGAEPDRSSVQVMLGGETISAVTYDATKDLFRGTVKFDDEIFDPSLDGPQTLVVRAANQRGGGGVVRVSNTLFTADSDGPTIAVEAPSAGQLVSGVVQLRVKVTDAAGVDPSNVVATVAGRVVINLRPAGDDIYEGLFDTRELGNRMVFPTVVVRAKDEVGNQSSLGYVLALDNQGPLADLDPPPVREAKRSELLQALLCGQAFDPVGIDSLDDGESAAQLSELRARVEDRANTASGAVEEEIVIPFGGVDPEAVQLFVLDDEGGALLVDTDGDGVCDDVNPELVPTSVPSASNEMAVIDLTGVRPNGGSAMAPPPEAIQVQCRAQSWASPICVCEGVNCKTPGCDRAACTLAPGDPSRPTDCPAVCPIATSVECARPSPIVSCVSECARPANQRSFYCAQPDSEGHPCAGTGDRPGFCSQCEREACTRSPADRPTDCPSYCPVSTLWDCSKAVGNQDPTCLAECAKPAEERATYCPVSSFNECGLPVNQRPGYCDACKLPAADRPSYCASNYDDSSGYLPYSDWETGTYECTEPPIDGVVITEPVCSSTPLTRVMATELGGDPAIWGIPPVSPTMCLGNAFDAVATNISDGWTCLAVRAFDALGNKGVSPVLRVCLEAEQDGDPSSWTCHPWGTVAASPYDCTGTYDRTAPAGQRTDPGQDCLPPASFESSPEWQVRRLDR